MEWWWNLCKSKAISSEVHEHRSGYSQILGCQCGESEMRQHLIPAYCNKAITYVFLALLIGSWNLQEKFCASYFGRLTVLAPNPRNLDSQILSSIALSDRIFWSATSCSFQKLGRKVSMFFTDPPYRIVPWWHPRISSLTPFYPSRIVKPCTGVNRDIPWLVVRMCVGSLGLL